MNKKKRRKVNARGRTKEDWKGKKGGRPFRKRGENLI